MANSPEGFEFRLASNGEVIITHWGQRASTLRGAEAKEFLMEVEVDDPQELMARVTGNYKRGSEGTAKNHSAWRTPGD